MFCQQLKTADAIMVENATSVPRTSKSLEEEIALLTKQHAIAQRRELEDALASRDTARLDAIARDRGYASNLEMLNSYARDEGFLTAEDFRTAQRAKNDAYVLERQRYTAEWLKDNDDLKASEGRQVSAKAA